MSVTEDIKSKLEIVNYIQQYVPLKKAGRYFKACCPFHSERTPSFVVNPDTQTWHCFGACATGGDIFTFAQRQHGWSFSEVLNELGKIAGVEIHQRTPVQKARDEAHDVLRGLLQTAADAYHQHLLADDSGSVATRRYVTEKRGFTDETIRKFGIGFAPPGWDAILKYLVQLGYSADQVIEAGLAIRNDAGRVYDRFRNRLMIPIRDERGRVVGFGARALDPDDTPKYLNSPQTPVFDKSRLLFALDHAKIAVRELETAVIVEGYMDAIQAHQAGFGNVVAQMGTALTETQIKLIAPRWAKKIILALDPDAAGQSATMRSLEVARETLQADFSGRLSVDMRILQIPDAKDPDDLIRESPEHWRALVEAATPVAEYVIDVETASLPPNASVQEREAAARRVLPILTASENNLYNQDNLQKLAMRLRISERDLLTWAQEQRRIESARPPRSSAPTTGDEPLEPPTRDHEPEGVPGSQPAVRPVRVQDAALEAYCLRLLLRNHHLIYQVNRKFRELAGDNADLRGGPLAELCPDDFSRSDYRVLVQAFYLALEQDGMEPLDFLRSSLDDSLARELEALMRNDEDEVRSRMRNRQPAEITATWKHHERYNLPLLDLTAELVHRVLDLRRRRLQREREELRFLQMEAVEEGVGEQYMHPLTLAINAKRLIEKELFGQNAVTPRW